MLSSQLGIPTGLPPLLDMNDEENDAVDLAVQRIKRLRKTKGG